MNPEALSDTLDIWAGRTRAAAERLRARSPLFHGLAVLAVSALGVSLVSRQLDPVVLYAYWNAICWPIDGLLIGVMLMCRRRDWPWIMMGYVVAMLPGRIGNGVSPLMTVMDNLCNILEMSIAALVLPAFTELSEWLRHPRLILRFSLFAVIGAPLMPALIWSWFNVYYSHWNFWLVVRRWESGDVLTIALFTPLVFVLISKQTRLLFRPEKLVETLAMFGILILAVELVFHQRVYPLAFIMFPILVVMANRLGFPGAVLAVNVLNVLAAKATVDGHGPFMLVQGVPEIQRMLTLQIYLTLAMVTSFGIALNALERNDFQEKLKLTLKQMEVLATHDGLTGLGNRRLFDLTLESEWVRARREGRWIALLLLDADCFKAYNDLYGHIAGDECLCAIAGRLRAAVRRGGDLAARYGGEEFVVLLPDTTLEQAAQVGELVRHAVESLQIEHKNNKSQCVTVSVGCAAMVPEFNAPSQRLVCSADEALYAAKQSGRNRVVRSGDPVSTSSPLVAAAMV